MPGDGIADVEEWRPVAGWEGIYEVSDHGRVRSLPRTTLRSDGRIRRVPGGIMKAPVVRSRSGVVRFCKLVLNDHGTDRCCAVHTLVLEAFVGPCPEGHECCHNDGDPTNNRLENIRWDTRQSNMDDKARHGTVTRGVRHAMAKLNDAAVTEMRRRHSDGVRLDDLVEAFGVSRSTVCRVLNRQIWSHVP